MGIKTVRHPSYSPHFAPCDFWLFPKLRGCRYETIEEMKEAVTKVIDTLPQEDFHGAFQKLLDRYHKCIAAGGDDFEGEESFMCVLSIKVPIQKKSGNLSYAPRMPPVCKAKFKSIAQFAMDITIQVHLLCKIFAVSWNYILEYELLIYDGNTWIYTTVCKLHILDKMLKKLFPENLGL